MINVAMWVIGKEKSLKKATLRTEVGSESDIVKNLEPVSGKLCVVHVIF